MGREDRPRLVVVAAVAAGVLAVVVIAAVLLRQRHVPEETVLRESAATPTPTATASPSVPRPTATFAALTAEQIRHHPKATHDGADDYPATGSPVRARTWRLCLGECSGDRDPVPGEDQRALEVSRDDFATGALYRLDGSENISHAVDDWYVVDAYGGASLVDSRGHRRPLRLGVPVAASAVAGPLVYSRAGLAAVDLPRRVLHPVARAGEALWDWQGAGDSWFWGTIWLVDDTTVTQQAAVWRRSDGRFAARVLPIGDSGGSSGMLSAGRPGTMAVVEHWATPRLAHISTDYGATWQVRVVPPDVQSGGELPDDWSTWATSDG